MEVESRKMRKIFFIFIVAVMIILIGCTSKTASYGGLSFKELCAKTNGMWMKMQPTKDLVPTSQPACMGCMLPNGDHICDKEQYLQLLKR